MSAEGELRARRRVPREGEAREPAAHHSGCPPAGAQGQGPAGPADKGSARCNPGAKGPHRVVNQLVITFIAMPFLREGPNYSCFKTSGGFGRTP